MRIKSLLAQTLIFCCFTGSAFAADVTGTWEYRGRSESGLWLLTQQKGMTVRFQLEISRGAPSYNSGWIEGEFVLAGKTGVFRSTENGPCTISFDFKKSSVVVREADDAVQECGFGFNVHADGTLKLKSRKPPKFTNSDPRSGQG